MSSAEIAPNFYDCEDLDKHVSEEVWYAIAGQGVMVPQAGELVVYFPQGHLQQSGGVSKHLKDVPSQITCRLLNLELKSKKDFVYALLLLEPEPNRPTSTNAKASCVLLLQEIRSCRHSGPCLVIYTKETC